MTHTRLRILAILLALLCLTAGLCCADTPPKQPAVFVIDFEVVPASSGGVRAKVTSLRWNGTPFPAINHQATNWSYPDGQTFVTWDVQIIPPFTAYTCQASTNPIIPKPGDVVIAIRFERLETPLGVYSAHKFEVLPLQ